MKKWLIIIVLFIGVLFQTTAVFAEETNHVTASMDTTGKVTIIGNIGTEAGKMVNITIIDPSGKTVYVGYGITAYGGSLIKTQDIGKPSPGKYSVYVGALGLGTPIKSEIEYGTIADLSELRLSIGSLNEAFNADELSYTATVNHRTDQIRVIPTASDSLATIKVNQKEVVSGNQTDLIALQEGENIINIVVTAKNGATKTYTIRINRTTDTATELTGEASINDKNQLVIQGKVDSGPGQMILLRITNPDDACIYVGTVISQADGGFSKTYSLKDELKGRYQISVGTLGLSQPLELICDYGMNAKLESLKVDTGSFETGFSPEIEGYALKISLLTKAIKVTALPQDPGATIKINGKAPDENGMITVAVDSHLHAIEVEVTAQDQITRAVYKIMLSSDLDISATLGLDGKVQIEGKVISPESLVAIMVVDPTGGIDYVGFTKSQKDSGFRLSYKMNKNVPGQYKVIVNTLDLVHPAYTYFNCLSDENHLKSLTVGGIALSPSFDADTMAYVADVPYSADSVKVTATAKDEAADVCVNHEFSETSSASGNIALDVGANTIVIEVTAENGEIRTYKIILNRYQPPVKPVGSANNYLSALTVDKGVFVNAFNPQGTEFMVNVPNDVPAVTIWPVTQESHAKVKVDGEVVNSEKSSGDIALVAGGTRRVLVEVTAENGSKRTYIVNIKRAVSSNVLLSMLTLNNGELEPQFDSSTNSYEVQVPNNISGVSVTPTAADDTATITVNGSGVLSGHASGLIEIPSGSSTLITITVEAQNKATNTYLINVRRASSANTDLANLSVSAGTLDPVFKPSESAYKVEVPYDVSNIKLTPTAADLFQTIKIKGVTVISGHPSQNLPLVVGSNEILVAVTGQNGSTKTYRVDVIRGSSNEADLSQLLLKTSSEEQIAVDISQSTTAINVSNAVTGLQIYATTANAGATMEVNGSELKGGLWTDNMALNVGENNMTVKVTAQDRLNTKTYTIKVTRAPSSDASLSMLTANTGNLSPDFLPEKTDYTLNVANDVEAITLTPTVNESHATVTVNGQKVNSGTSCQISALVAGEPKSVQVVVTAEDGTTTKTYRVTINRGLSNNCKLSSLTISDGGLSPAFDKDTTSYEVAVANTVTAIWVTPTVEENQATVRVNGTTVTSGQKSEDIALASGAVTRLEVLVTAQDGTTKTYTINVNRAPSDNANLASLTPSVSRLDSEFDPDDTEYTVNVANSVTSISFSMTVEESHARIQVGSSQVASGYSSLPISLEPGSNTVTVLVTAQSGKTRTYTINVVRDLTDDGSLSHLQVRIYGNYVIPLDTVISDFDLSFANTVTSVEVVATAVEEEATIKLNGTEVKSGIWSAPVNLAVGTNTFTVLVTAPDGKTTKTYTIKMERRGSTDAALTGLTTSSGTLSPAFNAGVTSYNLMVANDVEQITFTPWGSDTSSGITVDGRPVDSGQASQWIDLVAGVPKDVAIVVTAQDKTTTETYTVRVTRSLSANADLSSLSLSAGSLSPDFNKDTTVYTVSVGNDVTDMRVTPVADEAKSIQVNGVAVNNGSASQSIPLNVGDNTIDVVVEAQNGNTKTYRLTVDRAPSSNANLAGLIPSAGSLNPVFDGEVTAYEVTVDKNTDYFAVTPTAEDPTAVIHVKGNPVASGTKSGDYSVGYGQTEIEILVTAQDGTKKSYVITVNRPLSADASLALINTDQGTLNPLFNSETTEYTMDLNRSVEAISIWGVRTDDQATVTYKLDNEVVDNLNFNLAVGVTHQAQIIVTAQDSTTIKTYTISVTRLASDDATLSSLTVDSGSWDPEFAAGTYQYQIEVANTRESITLRPVKSDENAVLVCQVAGSNQELIDGAVTVTLADGESKEVTFTLTAENTTTSKTYRVDVSRAAGALSNNAYLADLAVSENGWLDPESFDKNTLAYTLFVYNDKDSVVLTPRPEDLKATLSYKLDGIDKGPITGDIAVTDLQVGVNRKVEIEVRAEDGKTIKTYAITLVRSRLLRDFEVFKVVEPGTENKLASLDLNSTAQELTVTVPDGSGLVRIAPVFEDGKSSPEFAIQDDTITATYKDKEVTYKVEFESTAEASNGPMLRADGSIGYLVSLEEEVTLTITVTENGEARSYQISLKQPQ